MGNDRFKIGVIIILFILFLITGYYAYTLREKYLNTINNNYNKAFSEAVNHINNIENFLAKTQITKNTKYSAETLAEIWHDANLAMIYLSEIPFNSENNSKTIKFLNQVSDYSFLLAKKNFNGDELSEEDFENLSKLYDYSKDLEMVLNQLSEELYGGELSFKELQDNTKIAFAQEVGNLDVFSNIDSTFNEYEGLIYDGAFSEHLNRNEKKAVIGEELTEDQAKEKIKTYISGNIKEIQSTESIQDVDIPTYSFYVLMEESDEKFYIEITKTGGLLYQMNSSRNVGEAEISQYEANIIGLEYLNQIGFKNMRETYFTKRENIVTVNYAYVQDDVVCYPDLIKVKIALDKGEILGVETKGYLNCHYERKLEEPKVTLEEAKEKLNRKIGILSEGKAVIPDDMGNEIFCYEFKGKVEDKEFLVYVDVNTGEEENILIILETEGGTLTI